MKRSTSCWQSTRRSTSGIAILTGLGMDPLGSPTGSKCHRWNYDSWRESRLLIYIYKRQMSIDLTHDWPVDPRPLTDSPLSDKNITAVPPPHWLAPPSSDGQFKRAAMPRLIRKRFNQLAPQGSTEQRAWDLKVSALHIHNVRVEEPPYFPMALMTCPNFFGAMCPGL